MTAPPRALYLLVVPLIFSCGCGNDVEESKLKDTRSLASALGRVDTRGRLRYLSTKRPGVLAELQAVVGERVKNGQLLATLDCAEELAALSASQAGKATAHAAFNELLAGTRVDRLKEAEAKLLAAQHRYQNILDHLERQNELDESGLSTERTISDLTNAAEEEKANVGAAAFRLKDLSAGPRKNEVALASAKLDEANALYELAVATVDGCALRAPMDGEVLRIKRRPGEYVNPQFGDHILVFADSNNLVIRAEFDERDSTSLTLGQEVLIRTLDSTFMNTGSVVELPRLVGRSTIRSVEPDARYDNDILEVLIGINDESGRLYLGQQVVVEVQ